MAIFWAELVMNNKNGRCQGRASNEQ